MSATTLFEVQQYCLCGGWQNTWLVDDQPQRFDTRAEAQAELDEFLAEIQAEIDAGARDPDAGYSPHEFRIAAVTNTSSVNQDGGQ